MQKKFLVIISIFLFLCFQGKAQDFDVFFINKTLRINYLHIGKQDMEKIEVKEFFAGGKWNGTYKFLRSPNRYGDMLFEVFDVSTDSLIFSRSYSTLFLEYRSTERAETEIGNFEESVTLPFPKNEIRYVFTTFDRKGVPTKLFEGKFNPKTTEYKPFTKEFKVMTLHKGNTPDRALDILFLPDGYSKADKKKMKADLKRFAEYIINCSPYKENADKVNIRAIEAYSEESGITDPRENVYKKTLFNSSFNVLDLGRYLMCLNVWKMHEIADDAPYDVLVLVCNTPKYGGGGIYNFYCTVNTEGKSPDYVIVHELGHLLGGLADEYYTSEVSVRDYYPEGVEPAEPNLTTLVDFDSKWKSMLAEDTPVPTPDEKSYDDVLGVFEGGGYVAQGVYRPVRSCTMKDIVYNHFCPVCTKVLLEALHYYSEK